MLLEGQPSQMTHTRLAGTAEGGGQPRPRRGCGVPGCRSPHPCAWCPFSRLDASSPGGETALAPREGHPVGLEEGRDPI